MISFKQFITEALDSSYPVVYNDIEPRVGEYTFTADGVKFKVAMYRYSKQKTYVEILFGASQNGGTLATQPTGATKNALKVYSTIGKELKEYIKKYPVDYITFSSVTPRTYVIYEQLAKRIARELNGTIKKPYMLEGTWEIHL